MSKPERDYQTFGANERLLAGSISPNNSLVPAIKGTGLYASNASIKTTKDSTSPSKPDIERNKPIDLETHGDEAITLLQKKGGLRQCFDITRLTFGSLLLALSIFSIVYAIIEHRTLMPTSFPNFTLYIILIICLFCLGIFEGLQIAVVELAHEDPYFIKTYYPRAAKLLKWENTGRNVERFLIGRQVLVVLLVFVCARVTTFDIWIIDLPNWIISSFMFSGFLGVILVVTVAQLTPQVLAAAYPIEFLNLPGMNIAFSACLFVESTGIAHAVWILCVTVKQSVYSCVCKYHALNKKSMMQLKHKKETDKFKYAVENNGYMHTKEMADVAKSIEMSVDEESISKSKRENKNGLHDDKDQDFTINNSKVIHQIEELMQQVDNRPDLFYLYGDDKYVGPSYYYDKFKESGLNIPCFLLPPNDKNHIPPHIVAMALLKSTVDSRNNIV